MNKEYAQQIMSEVETDYDTISKHFSHTRMNQWYEVDYLVNQYVQPGQTVLDLGCGNGRVADLVTQIKGLYLGMDVSEKLIEIARQLHPGLDFRVGNMMQTGFEDKAFHHVMLIASFHHIPSHDLRLKMLLEAKRIVKDDGYITMTNWNLHQWRYVPMRTAFNFKGLIQRHKMDWNDVRIPWYDQEKHLLAKRYYHAFTPAEMKRLGKKAGLRMADQYFEKNGLHVPRRKGHNLVSVFVKT